VSIIASFGDTLVEYQKRYTAKDINLTIPYGLFGRVLHDFELAEFDFKPRQLEIPNYKNVPVPATRMLWGRYNDRVYDFVPFVREWQYWLKDLLDYTTDNRVPIGEVEYYYTVEAGKEIKGNKTPYSFVKYTEGSLLWAYSNLIADHRSFTDTQAPENNRADYVTGRNVTQKPYSWKCLVTTGNIVRILGLWNEYYIIEALDLLKPPPPVEEVHNKSWLIHWATEQGLTKIGSRWTVARYPQIKVACRVNGMEESGTPFPLASMGGTNLIKKSHVRIVSGKYSPYVPEK
jgi:hypothetical protein